MGGRRRRTRVTDRRVKLGKALPPASDEAYSVEALTADSQAAIAWWRRNAPAKYRLLLEATEATDSEG